MVKLEDMIGLKPSIMKLCPYDGKQCHALIHSNCKQCNRYPLATLVHWARRAG